MKRIKTTVGTLFMLAGAAFAGQWQRNTFPGQGHVDNNFAPGAGWGQTEAVQDISVSPSDPNFRAMIANEWTMVYTEDGRNYKPLRMPHIGTPGTAADSVDFSPHDRNTIYLRVTHNYWTSMNPTNSPAGLWRSTDRGRTWKHLYQAPAGGYQVTEPNNAGRSRMLEDPSPLRSNHIYFGTSTDGLKRSTDNGATWQDVVPELANRRIKTVMAVAAANNQTYLYTIAEKTMPRQLPGDRVPVALWRPPSDYDARWRFNQDLKDTSTNGNILSGTVAGWTDSTMEGKYAAKFNGSSPLTSTNLTYSQQHQKLSVVAWVQTSSTADQSIVSFDRNQYWELGTRAGRFTWTVRDSGGAVNTIEGLLPNGAIMNDGDWHHVAAVFDRGTMWLFVNGEQVAKGSAGTSMLGSGNPVSGVIGAGFTGALDDVHIFNSRALSLLQAQAFYLIEDHKNPVVQGQLWRIRVNADGDVAEAKRLHAPLADFHDVEVNPQDPSQGWVIRKGIPQSWPYGGRELYTFSNFGGTLKRSTAQLGESETFDVVMINPGDTQHVLLACAASRNSGIRWSRDGGATWTSQGLNRKAGNYIPSIKSWMPMDYKTYTSGIEADGLFEHRGSPFSFVPGKPDQLLWVAETMGGLLQSDNYGATWRTYAAGGPNKDIGQIAVAHSNPDYWAVGLYEHGWSVTTNGGLRWYAETHDNNSLLHSLSAQADSAGIGWTPARGGYGVAFHPINPNIMVATWSQMGYILRSTNAGISWSNTNSRDQTGELVDVFWSRTNANRVYAGSMRSDDAGLTWVENGNGVGSGKIVIAVCDSNPDLIVGVDYRQTNVKADSLGMYVSKNGGSDWLTLPDPPRETVPGTNEQWLVTGTSRKWNTMADALVAIDPGSSSLRILLAGRSGVYEYNEGSNKWTINKTGLKNNRHLKQTEQVPWMGFVAFDPRPGFSHIVYAASQNDDATQGAWSGEGNPNRTYPGGENTDPYYRSTDGGITWEHLHGHNFPDAPSGGMIESMTVDSRGRMFAATTEGVYIYTDQTPTLASRGTIVATVTAPTGGGNKNIEIIRDGVKPAVGSTDSSLQYDTSNGSGGPLEEHIGYTFGSAPTFTKVIFQEGRHFTGGGWWANGSVVVQVRQGGTWNTVSATVSPAYPNGNTQAAFGKSFETYTFTLAEPTTGDGIRLSGTAGGGSAPFISVGELEIIGNHPPVFVIDPVVKGNATEGTSYSASITGSASDVDAGARLNYSKISGSAWLTVAASGALSGTPANGDVGLIRFTVGVSDGNGGTASATLEITVAAQTLVAYALWASDHEVGAMDEDFDKDGLDNLTEYALGGNPANANDVGLLPTHVKTADGWHYVYRRHLDPAAAGLVYTVETTTNLASGEWTETGTVEIDTDEIDSEFESVINAVDTTDKPTLFIRLKIEAR